MQKFLFHLKPPAKRVVVNFAERSIVSAFLYTNQAKTSTILTQKSQKFRLKNFQKPSILDCLCAIFSFGSVVLRQC